MISHNHKRFTFTITGENGPFLLLELQYTGFCHVICPVRTITWMRLGQWDKNSWEDTYLVVDASVSSEARVLSRYSFLFYDFTMQEPFVVCFQWEMLPLPSLCVSICPQVSRWMLMIFINVRKSSRAINNVSAELKANISKISIFIIRVNPDSWSPKKFCHESFISYRIFIKFNIGELAASLFFT